MRIIRKVEVEWFFLKPCLERGKGMLGSMRGRRSLSITLEMVQSNEIGL